MIRDVTIDVSPRFSYERRVDDDPLSVKWPRIPPGYCLMLIQHPYMRTDVGIPHVVKAWGSADAVFALCVDRGQWRAPDQAMPIAFGAEIVALWNVAEWRQQIDFAMQSGALFRVTAESGLGRTILFDGVR